MGLGNKGGDQETMEEARTKGGGNEPYEDNEANLGGARNKSTGPETKGKSQE
jgi:hypothetical protein